MERINLNETAYLEYAPLDKNFDGKAKPVLLILPGGAYTHLADHEAYPIADAARASGMHACILRYTVLTERIVEIDDLLDEISQTLDFLDSRAKEDSLDMSQVTVLGFSAGGHLAAMAANRLSDRFARACLCYPAAHMDFTEEQKASEEEAEAMAKEQGTTVEVLTKMGEFFMDWPENYIHEGSVPTFIYHSQNDPVCPIEGTLQYYSKLCAAHIPAALHVFTTGEHGKSLGNKASQLKGDDLYPELSAWWDLFQEWLALDL